MARDEGLSRAPGSDLCWRGTNYWPAGTGPKSTGMQTKPYTKKKYTLCLHLYGISAPVKLSCVTDDLWFSGAGIWEGVFCQEQGDFRRAEDLACVITVAWLYLVKFTKIITLGKCIFKTVKRISLMSSHVVWNTRWGFTIITVVLVCVTPNEIFALIHICLM